MLVQVLFLDQISFSRFVQMAKKKTLDLASVIFSHGFREIVDPVVSVPYFHYTSTGASALFQALGHFNMHIAVNWENS